MKAVLQRVKYAKVEVDGEIVGQCDKGLMILLGVAKEDTEEDARLLAEKIVKHRIFRDENGKMNLSVKDVGGEVLLVSQFTLYGDTSKGFRPSFTLAARPETAKPLYDYAAEYLKEQGVVVKKGVFGADMQIEQHNDGPVTILLEN